MELSFSAAWQWVQLHNELHALLATSALVLIAWVANWIVKRILVRGFYRLVRLRHADQWQDFGVVRRLANIVPALIISSGVDLVPGLPDVAITVVRNVCSAFIVLTIILALTAVLDIINYLHHRRKDTNQYSIKGYIQVAKIVLYLIAAVLVVAALIDKSPLILLSGVGAMAAVLMLVFQDTILSLVASVQIMSNDMVRVGDWIEMPNLNADGDVIDIALHTVKVQNWDKTITTIPTKRLITDSFKNWRGMQQSGGRRIKRSLYLDQQSVRFLEEDEILKLRYFNLLEEYLDNKLADIGKWNALLPAQKQNSVNIRRLTNIGTFRAYIERYLRHHPGVHQGMTIMVRQLSPTADGLPLEVYCFTNTVAWVLYEGIQSDIFDHLLAIMPEFGLRVFQHPSGADMRELAGRGEG